MARPIRVEFEGAVYHVTARGNERKLIYRTDEDRAKFLETLEKAIQEHGLRVHAYCLMPNHFHLLVETPRGNLSRAIGWVQTAYSNRFNYLHRRSGPVFQGRFKAHIVDADNYAKTLLRYVHLNPVRPRNKTAAIPAEHRGRLANYAWSSHQAYAGRVPAPSWLCMDWLSYFARGAKEAQRQYRRFVDGAFGSRIENPWANLRLGLVLGNEETLARVRGFLKAKPGQDEVRLVRRLEKEAERQCVSEALAEEQSEQDWQIWVRVRLGAERRVDVARAYGYKDGSAITQVLKRLEASAQSQSGAAARMAKLRHRMEKWLSAFES